MLDKRTAAVLSAINSLCGEGKYEIVEREELLRAASLPEGEEKVEEMLSYLAENGYIDVKYTDRERGLYCLYPLPAGRAYAEKVTAKRLEKKRTDSRAFLFTALAAFVGSVLGAGMVAFLLVALG